MMKDNFKLKTFVALFHLAKPTQKELKLIVENIPEDNCEELMTIAVKFQEWPLALLIAKTYFLPTCSEWEYKIEKKHEEDNVACHDLIHYFGFPRDFSSYEFDCKLCDKLRSGTYGQFRRKRKQRRIERLTRSIEPSRDLRSTYGAFLMKSNGAFGSPLDFRRLNQTKRQKVVENKDVEKQIV
jgi:hypothetical protein